MAETISTLVLRQWPLVDPVEACSRTRGEGGGGGGCKSDQRHNLFFLVYGKEKGKENR
jgi:hypothetical protein